MKRDMVALPLKTSALKTAGIKEKRERETERTLNQDQEPLNQDNQPSVIALNAIQVADDDSWRHALAVGPTWIERYLIKRSSCSDERSAAIDARVSVAIVRRELAKNREFAELNQRAIEGSLRWGTGEATRIACEESAPLVINSIKEAYTNPDSRVRLGFSRLLAEQNGTIQSRTGTGGTTFNLGAGARVLNVFGRPAEA